MGPSVWLDRTRLHAQAAASAMLLPREQEEALGIRLHLAQLGVSAMRLRPVMVAAVVLDTPHSIQPAASAGQRLTRERLAAMLDTLGEVLDTSVATNLSSVKH